MTFRGRSVLRASPIVATALAFGALSAGCGGAVTTTDAGKVNENGCPAESTAPIALVQGLPLQPRNLAILGPHAYFVAGIEGDSKSGRFMRVPLTGGAVESLADAANPIGVATDGTEVYWTSQGDGLVGRYSPSNGVTSILATGQTAPGRMAPDGVDGVFWVNNGTGFSGAGIRHFSRTAGSTNNVATGRIRPIHIALDDTDVYFTNIDADQIVRVPRGGGDLVTILPGSGGQTGLAVDATRVYWTAEDGVFSVDKNGQAPATLATGQATPASVIVDDRFVYWANYGSAENNGVPAALDTTGSVMRSAKDGARPEVFALGQAHPRGLTQDKCHVYWVGEGRVMKRAK